MTVHFGFRRRVEPDVVGRCPGAGSPLPAQRVAFARLGEDLATLGQDGNVLALMALLGRHERERAVTVLGVGGPVLGAQGQF